MIILFTYIF